MSKSDFIGLITGFSTCGTCICIGTIDGQLAGGTADDFAHVRDGAENCKTGIIEVAVVAADGAILGTVYPQRIGGAGGIARRPGKTSNAAAVVAAEAVAGCLAADAGGGCRCAVIVVVIIVIGHHACGHQADDSHNLDKIKCNSHRKACQLLNDTTFVLQKSFLRSFKNEW